MSLYAEYLAEKGCDCIIESDTGFATYRQVDATTIYIIDIYVVPWERKAGHATRLADRVAEEGRRRGCTNMLGTVCTSMKGATDSLRVLLAYGMTLKSASENLIIMQKGI